MNEPITEASYRMLWQEGADLLSGILKDKREAELDARLLLEHVCGTRIDTLLTEPERRVSAENVRRYRDLIARRCAREPLAYIVGSTDFMGLRFEVRFAYSTYCLGIISANACACPQQLIAEYRNGLQIHRNS